MSDYPDKCLDDVGPQNNHQSHDLRVRKHPCGDFEANRILKIRAKMGEHNRKDP